MFVPALALLPVVFAAAPEPLSLTTLAAASPRPQICRLAFGASDGELWARARRERAQRFCVLLSRGYARLDRAPADALALAREASRILPTEIEARVLEGRALLRFGSAAEAERLLARSVMAPGRPLGDLAGLRELGVAFALTGQVAEAARVYRVLVPRVDFMKDRLFARISVLEASAASMASTAEGAQEAASYLGEARQGEPVPGYQDLTLAFFALALDRGGKTEQAQVALEELAGPWQLERFLPDPAGARPGESSEDAVVTPARAFSDAAPTFAGDELHAAIGLAAARTDPKLARAHFDAFVGGAGGRGPFAAWGRKWLALLGREGKP